jgi:hypothetical protein
LNKGNVYSSFPLVRLEFWVYFGIACGRFYSPNSPPLFHFTTNRELSFPFPTKNKTKKIEKKQQSISFVAASVVALQASPALALNAIELTDKRAENVGGLQLIYEVWFYSYRFV